ncbi:hypothetical protein BTUL_0117g00010 [Botrytis tulipae]|uniref:Rhodopsin domain-containing protein n=1 Tax=Botrytis tulipae TaxID=87230 RepID=A0A4Z1EFR5_9HELO|nr:hypothetical protein BTUL_0117g00010 [Botrytis tulipae]
MSSYPSAKSPPPADGDQGHGTRMLIVIVTTFTVVVVIFCLRLSVRLFVVRSMGWDDYSIIAATAAATVCNAFNINYIHSGGGRHSYYLGIQGEINASKWSTLAQLPFIIATTFTKVSICFMIVRITNSKRLVRFMWVMIGALIVINLMGFIVVAARCTPFEAGWNYYTIQGKCWPHKVLEVQSYIQGVFSIVTDFTCTMLSIIVLWNIQISVQQKIAICGLVAMGLLVTASPTDMDSTRTEHRIDSREFTSTPPST